MKFILGRKLNMSQVFTKDGVKIAVTAIEAGPCQVVEVKSEEKDGYRAVQLGFGKRKHLNRAQKGHQKDGSWQYLREFRIKNGDYKVGQVISVAAFAPGDRVTVSGIMKGRGFTGAMKRHGFHGAPASHGHDHPRAVGSIGSRFPQHTLKGTRMAGRMGGHQVTTQGAVVMDIDPEKNLVWLKGPVPGAPRGLVKLSAEDATNAEGKGVTAFELFSPSLPQAAVKEAQEAGQSGAPATVSEAIAEEVSKEQSRQP